MKIEKGRNSGAVGSEFKVFAVRSENKVLSTQDVLEDDIGRGESIIFGGRQSRQILACLKVT